MLDKVAPFRSMVFVVPLMRDNTTIPSTQVNHWCPGRGISQRANKMWQFGHSKQNWTATSDRVKPAHRALQHRNRDYLRPSLTSSGKNAWTERSALVATYLYLYQKPRKPISNGYVDRA